MRRQRAFLVAVVLLAMAQLSTLWRDSFTTRQAVYAPPAVPTGVTTAGRKPAPVTRGHVEAGFAARMRALRTTILAAAARHNRPQLSGLSDAQFAEVVAQLLYNEHNG